MSFSLIRKAEYYIHWTTAAGDEDDHGNHMSFWIPWTIDLLAAGVLSFFFLAGLADGSVSSFNIGIWLAMLGTAGGVLYGSWWLRSRGRKGPAAALAWLLAAPALLLLAFFSAFIIIQPDFR